MVDRSTVSSRQEDIIARLDTLEVKMEEMASERKLANDALNERLNKLDATVDKLATFADNLVDIAKVYEAVGILGKGLRWLAAVIAAVAVLWAVTYGPRFLDGR